MGCRSTLITGIAGVAVLAVTAGWASAQKVYSPGVTDTEIKIGTTAPFSGPASAYSVMAVSGAAYYAMINDNGGINGRKINYVTLDDGYSPPKTVEQVRKLIESEEVLFIASPVGTAPHNAVVKYINRMKVPDLFVGSGATMFNDPERYPWTVGWFPHYASEGAIYAKYVLANAPDAKIGILSQNDDLGRDYLSGFKRILGERADKMIVLERTYNVTDPSIDSQVVSLKAAGADVVLIVATPKFAAQAMRKAWDLNWSPLKIVVSIGSGIAAAMKPAGFDASKGVISAATHKDPADPQWANDPEMKKWNEWMDKYNPHSSKSDSSALYGYSIGTAVTNIIRQAGDNLTRENIMNIATHLDMELPLLLPGIKLRTTPYDHRPIKQMNLVRFDGERYVMFGDVMSSD